MDKTLGYLREVLSNYLDEQQLPQAIYSKLEENNYQSESDFIRKLDEEEIEFLNKVLPDEISYALDEKDYKRVQELNEVYELL